MNDAQLARSQLKNAKRVVVKIGSALLARDDTFAEEVARQISSLAKKNIKTVVVTSGAIALGLPLLGLSKRPRDLPNLQAAAAAGQVRLMASWETAFAKVEHHVGQILLTHADLASRKRYLNARDALTTLLDRGLVPVVNENDSVSVDEIKLGDNDTLAAEVAGLVSADALLLLTGAEGMFTAPPDEPDAVRIPFVDEVDDALRGMAGAPALFGTGGMHTKLQAAEIARRHGIATLIARGTEKDVLARLLDGEDLGTLFAKNEVPQGSRKLWIGSLRGRGVIDVDKGAKDALQKNASLLYAGVTSVEGIFEKGDAVDLRFEGVIFARGLISLANDDAQRVAGMQTEQARATLGNAPRVLFHRDDVVWLEHSP
ncbi:MAG: glutamate 5-kinase [Deltaproteobacteria bacterium]|nr:glutamate 5-kinase [Deltaproteobacteria bacterium]